MKIIIFLFAFIIVSYCKCFSQIDMKTYEGGWSGSFENKQAFNFVIKITHSNNSSYEIQIFNYHSALRETFNLLPDSSFIVKFDDNLLCRGLFKDGNIHSFIQSGKMQYYTELTQDGNNSFTGKWNPLIIENINPVLHLSIENASGDNFEAYPVSGDNRFPGFWCYGFIKINDTIYFQDMRTGLQFAGKLADDKIFLDVKLAGTAITYFNLKRTEGEFSIGKSVDIPMPGNLNDGWIVSDDTTEGLNGKYLEEMTDSINAGNITNIHSVLIARNGKLVFERYFSGYDSSIPHDMRSTSKSISSALIGIAIDKGIIKNTDTKLYDLLPEQYKNILNSDEQKKRITIHSLLTMSSGLDAVDFGTDRKSQASEDNYQSTEDWIKTVLEAPMINEPGTHANYGSANPFLLGIALDNSIKQPLELFIHENLFAPLNISNYIIQNDNLDRPYFAGGMFMTPRDMLKFGQLYLNKGKWNGRTIISEDWIERSLSKYLTLENTESKNEYGYLWWYRTYNIGNKKIAFYEARGAGGQYIFVIPEYNLTAVITSGNFRNGRYWQPEKVMEKYILPSIYK